MKTEILKKPFKIALAALAVASSFLGQAEACTRIVYNGTENLVITGRSMDWAEDIKSNIWVFPRGIQRDGAVDASSPKWTSKYGSLIVTGYDVGTADGMNETGFVANALYLAESDYGKPSAGKPLLSISLWAQYVLDNFSSVSEAVEALGKESFQIVAPTLPNGAAAQLHLAISDPTGDSAIFEYIDGKLVIHHGKQYAVMTNSPSYDQQIALNTYWQNIGGQVFLPGTSRAADRYVRASFYLGAIPKKADPDIMTAVPNNSYSFQSVASVLSVIRGVSVPLGIKTPNQPNIASTLWRTLSNQKDKIYFFDSATSPNTFWIPLSDLNFKENASVMKLTIAGGKIYSGNAVSKLEQAQSFIFLPAKP